MRRPGIYRVAALSLAVFGCASSGTRIDDAALSEVRKGQTTVAEVVSKFGRPNFLSRNLDGTQTAAYAYSGGRSDAATLLPLMGAMVGGGGAGVDSVIFYFDTSGVLSDYKARQAAGATPAPVQVRADSPAPSGGETPAPVKAATPAQRNTNTFDLRSLLPSEIRDPRQ